ncbi:MAG: Gamma-glutamyltransferase [Actinomycetia bacterium]|jgi:gamma-glutamyltranspeptidase/glutathione hydrolase|nr:Gamma-glutamyltransferase [Actinomycetes bacterium]
MKPPAADGGSCAARGVRGAGATPHPRAAEAAEAAFTSGGNAVDAALHAAVTLAVVSPHMCGVGGDLFALVQNPDGKLVAIDSSGRAPAGADAEGLRGAHGTTMPQAGPATITVPGAVRGWEAVHRQGAVRPWAEAFGAAIDAAEGAPISHDLAWSIARRVHELRSDPGFAEVFYADGVPSEGALLRQPALARTLTAIADGGADALSAGDLAERFVAGLRALGAPISTDDLVPHAAELLPPLRGRYRDLDVSVTPPPSQGFVLLEALAAVERLGIDPDPIGVDAATLARILMAASSDRDRHLADPGAMTIHVSGLLDDGHIAALCDIVRGGLDGHPASAPVPPRVPGDTIALVTADADGWGVSLIQSLFSGFGAGILEPSTGIIPHDRGACFSLEPGHPNELAPGKRPAHTLMPVAVHRDGVLAALAGTRGGHGQPQIDLMTLVRAFDLGLDPSEAVAAPRWLVGGMSPLRGDPWIEVEGAVPAPVRAALAASGFQVRALDDLDRAVGHAMLLRADRGAFLVGSDPRADGGTRAA